MMQGIIDFLVVWLRMTVSNHRRRGAVLSSMLICICSTANANSGPYVGVKVVESQLDVDGFSRVLRTEPFEPFFRALPEKFDDQRATGWSVSGGYRFRRYFAIEVGFTDYGEIVLSPPRDHLAFPTHTTSTFLRNTTISLKGAHWVFVGSYPFGKWESYFKLGASRIDTLGSTRTIFNVYTEPGRVLARSTERDELKSETSTEATAALGVGYTIADHYVVNLEATRTPKVGGADSTGEGNLTSLSLGFQYRF